MVRKSRQEKTKRGKKETEIQEFEGISRKGVGRKPKSDLIGEGKKNQWGKEKGQVGASKRKYSVRGPF